MCVCVLYTIWFMLGYWKSISTSLMHIFYWCINQMNWIHKLTKANAHKCAFNAYTSGLHKSAHALCVCIDSENLLHFNWIDCRLQNARCQLQVLHIERSIIIIIFYCTHKAQAKPEQYQQKNVHSEWNKWLEWIGRLFWYYTTNYISSRHWLLSMVEWNMTKDDYQVQSSSFDIFPLFEFESPAGIACHCINVEQSLAIDLTMREKIINNKNNAEVVEWWWKKNNIARSVEAWKYMQNCLCSAKHQIKYKCLN